MNNIIFLYMLQHFSYMIEYNMISEYTILKLQSLFNNDKVVSVTNVDLKVIGKHEIKLIEEVKKHDE